MMSSRPITLFADPPPSRRGPSSFVISILLHGVAICVIYLGLKYSPRVEARPLDQRYTVRFLNLQKTPPQKRSAESGLTYTVPETVARTAPPGGSPAAPAAPRQLAQLIPAPQTLVQPDLPPNLLLAKETPIPLVVLWSPETSPVKKIVPPAPNQATAKVRPSLETPNREVNLADLKISATAFTTEAPALPPSTTSPLVVLGPEPAPQVPETASKQVGQPTPARVISLSDLQMQVGTIVIPMANETAPSSSSGSLTPGRPESTSETGSGKQDSKQNGIGTGHNPGDQGNKGATTGGSVARNGGTPGTGQGSGVNSGLDSEAAVVRIHLPETGQFGVVVVGSSLAEEYPETVGLWSGRLAYTVYLHVGLTKNWILQYSLPRAAQAAAAGSVTRPEAPWAYDIVRPTLAPGDFNADAVMVHGFVSTSGCFEQLAVVFPAQFSQTKFVLSALQQWHFRPAVQNGAITAVEVLLIIPAEPE